MISQVLIFLLFAAAPVDKINQSRRAYSSCLNTLVSAELAAKTDPSAFGAKLPTSCKAQEQAFRSAVVTVDVAAGVRRAVAEENASTEVKDFIDSAKESYLYYVENKTQPR